MVALAAYFDDSKNGGILAVAGYLGVVSEWDLGFAPAWQQEIIDAAPRPISEFKATDCENGFNEFKGWEKPERTALTVKCVDLIVDHAIAPHIFGLGAAVLARTPADFHARPTKGKKPDVEGLAYLMCFATVVLGAMQLAKNHLGEDTLELIFDTQSKMKRKVEIIFDLLLEEFPSLRGRVNEPVFRDSKKILPIQAADLLAYETYKEMKNRLEHPERSVRTALRRLVEGRLHAAHFYDRSVFAELRRRKREGTGSELITLPAIYSSASALRGRSASS